MVQITTVAALAVSAGALVIALIALSFSTFPSRTGYIGTLEWMNNNEEQQDQEEIDRSKPQVDYTLYTTGNYPCIMTENVSTPSYKVAVGNPSEIDVMVDMVVSARNADVSWDESTGFDQSSTKRITVLAGTPDQNQMETFYIKPHAGTGNLSLSMNAKAVEPADAPVSTYDQKIIAYFKNDAGNYCH